MRILLILCAAVSLFGETTFRYLPGFPVGCTDVVPTAIETTYKLDNIASCVIPGLRPPGDFAPPAVGGSYVDPTFGHTVTVSSSVGYYQTYSTPSPLSATGKYLAVVGKDTDSTIGGTTAIIEAKTGAWKRKVAGASQDWGFFWHPTDDERYFTLAGAAIYKRNVAANESVKVYEDPGGILTGGTGDISADLWMAYATTRDQAVGRLCAAPLDGTNKRYCIPLAGLIPANSNFDFALISKGRDAVTGKRYVMLEQGGRILEVDEAAGVLKDLGRSGYDWNHSDTMQGPDGRQYIFSTMGWPGSWSPGPLGGDALTFWLMADPKVKYKAFQTSWASPVVAGSGATHYNCSKAKPVCVAGFSPNAVGPTENAQGERQPYSYEAITITMLGPDKFEAQRLAKTRTVRRTFTAAGLSLSQDYDSMPMCGLSGNAELVACKTNWGTVPFAGHERPTSPGVRQVITIDARGGTAPPPPPAPADPAPVCPECPACPAPACDCAALKTTIAGMQQTIDAGKAALAEQAAALQKLQAERDALKALADRLQGVITNLRDSLRELLR